MFDHSKIDFQVEKFPLWSMDQVQVPANVGVGIRRTDNRLPLAVVSEEYEPVQYRDIVSGVEEALNLALMDLTDATFDTNVYDNGAKLELRAKFPAHKMSMREGKDSMVPEFVFRTSHNRTWANSGMMGLWRSFCYNTLVSGDKLAYVYGRHTKNFNVSGFASKVKTAGEFISGEGLTQMRGWYDTKVSRDGAINLFTNTLAQRTDNVSRKKVANKVMKRTDICMVKVLMKAIVNEMRVLYGLPIMRLLTGHPMLKAKQEPIIMLE